MTIEYLLKGIELKKEDKEVIEEKLEKLKRFSKRIQEIKVDLSYRPTRIKEQEVRLEINIKVPGKLLRAVVRDSDLLDAVDKIENKLKRQIRKYENLKQVKTKVTQKILRKIKAGEQEKY